MYYRLGGTIFRVMRVKSNNNTTIVSLAKDLDLGTTTISEILRNKPGYNEKTRQRVLAAAKQTGYSPNYLSRALVSGKSNSIGVLVPMEETPGLIHMIKGLEAQAQRYDYVCYLLGFSSDEQQVATQLKQLLQRRIDGLVVSQTSGSLPAVVEDILCECDIPVVRVGNIPSDINASVVTMDREYAAEMLAEHLAKLGHKHVAYVGGEFSYLHPENKVSLYNKAFDKVGIRLDLSLKWHIPVGGDYNYGCMNLINQRAMEGIEPTALVFTSDRTAMEALAALHDAGLRVPEDVSVVGFDDDYNAKITRPALTTIRQPRQQQGTAAFVKLHHLMTDQQNEVNDVPLPCELIIRDSTGPARTKPVVVGSAL